MRNEMSASACPAALAACTLLTVWHVDADASYHTVRRSMKQGGDMVALRTLEGVGEMQLLDGQTFALPKGALFLVKKAHIDAYRAKYERWHFYWFEFTFGDPAVLPTERVLELPLSPGEEGELERCFDALKVEKGRLAELAQALFQYRLMDWLVLEGGRGRQMRGDELVLLLSQGVREGLSVAQLAKRACMCERTFRILIRRYTGKSPKEYMLNDALDAALVLLRTTNLTVREVAENAGFANAFYFSRIFKSRFGLPPSKTRKL
ncbi:MAG: helix-turn-helix transcriptional regulator [Clostridia bacterium]